jgi:hypothetical protein
MARTFNKFEEDDKPEIKLPEEHSEEECEEPQGKTLRQSHMALKATDFFEVSKRKPEVSEENEMMNGMKSMVQMFKTLRMLMQMMKGLDVE